MGRFMYRVLIADDDDVEREVIRYLLSDFSLEISEAANGKSALTLMSEQKFDILITDIRMPYVDGIMLSKEVRALYPDIRIIFFSGYDDFSYAKAALKLNVDDYILKPVVPEEFHKTIANVLERIQINEDFLLQGESLNKSARNHMLYKLANGTDMQTLSALYPHMNFSFIESCHRLFLIQLKRDYFGDSKNGDNIISSLGLLQLLPTDCYFVNLNPAQNLLVFTGKQQPFHWYQDLAEKIVSQIHKTCGILCHIAISAAFSGPNEFVKSYKEAEQNLIDQYFSTDSSLIYTEKNDTSTQHNTPVPSKMNAHSYDDSIINQLKMDIQLKDDVGLIKHMESLIDAWKSIEQPSLIYFHHFCVNLLVLLLGALNMNTDENHTKFGDIILHSTNMSQVANVLLNLTEKLATQLAKEHATPKYELQQVKQYIHNHYNEDLSLDILAAKVFLTPRYLSALFIEENNCGINRYIKNVRMEKAKELLLSTNLSVNDIAQKVGYSNLSYFCKSFSEVFGTTPKKYRDKKI